MVEKITEETAWLSSTPSTKTYSMSFLNITSASGQPSQAKLSMSHFSTNFTTSLWPLSQSCTSLSSTGNTPRRFSWNTQSSTRKVWHTVNTVTQHSYNGSLWLFGIQLLFTSAVWWYLKALVKWWVMDNNLDSGLVDMLYMDVRSGWLIFWFLWSSMCMMDIIWFQLAWCLLLISYSYMVKVLPEISKISHTFSATFSINGWRG